MLKNYLKIAIRNLFKNKSYSIINIVGLSIGLACCILISLYVYQELNYDNFNNNADRIFRVSTLTKSPEGIEKNAQTSMPVAPALKQNFPEIQSFTRVYFNKNVLLKYNDNKFIEDNVIYADSDFFKIFSFNIIAGEKDKLLSAPFTIVLTRSMVEKYFGNTDPVGKMILLKNKKYFRVTGVVEDVPVNSHFHFDFVASYSSLTPEFMGNNFSSQWGAFFGNHTYALTNKDFDPIKFEQKTKNFLNQHLNPAPGVSSWLVYQPLKDLHMLSDFEGASEPGNSSNNLIIISLIGLFVLIIACINFVNITTSRSAQRSKEIGVRKTLGANKYSLVKQFIGESLLLSALSLLLAVIIVEIMLPYFNNLIGEKIVFGLFNQPVLFLGVIAITCIIGILAGFYPAFVLSKLNVAFAVKGVNEKSGKSANTLLKRILVVVQFSISVILIVATIVINNQIKFVKNADLGFNKENIIQVTVFDDNVREKFTTFKNEVEKVPGVISVSNCFGAPISKFTLNTDFYPNGRNQQGSFLANFDFIDPNFLDHFGLKLLAGRNFNQYHPVNDSLSIIINETALNKLGFIHPNDVIGKKYSIGMNGIKPEVIGVVKDFHFSSLHKEIAPYVFMNWDDFKIQSSIKINSANISQTISGIKKVWSEFSSSYPFQYQFIDETVDNLYKREDRQESIVMTFSIIAILIACLGLFGLASFSAQQRTKEIGVRKVFGASVTGIIGLITKDFLILTLIANLISIPIAWYLMNKWLNDFAYKINISMLTFVFAAIITIVIAILTVGWQAVKAATANPVKSIRYE